MHWAVLVAQALVREPQLMRWAVLVAQALVREPQLMHWAVLVAQALVHEPQLAALLGVCLHEEKLLWVEVQLPGLVLRTLGVA